MKFGSKILLLTSVIGVGGFSGYAATFQVTAKSLSNGASYMPLDESVDVSFTVSASGMTGSVVPILSPDPGTPQAIVDSLSITWLGEAALSPWSSSRVITFRLHLYNDPSICGELVDFDLKFKTLSTGVIDNATATSNAHLQISTTESALVTLQKKILEQDIKYTQPLFAGSTNTSGSLKFLGNYTQAELDNPANRVFLYVDYAVTNVNGTAVVSPEDLCDAFNDFEMKINFEAFSCRFNWPNDLMKTAFSCGQSKLVTGPMFDNTGGSPVEIDSAPLGGGGISMSATGQGINVFDITDIIPVNAFCGGQTIRNILPTGTGPGRSILATMGPFNRAYIRDIRFYLGTQGQCEAFSSNFGTAPAANAFYIKNFNISSEGKISGEIEVPAAWKSGNNLASGIRATWIFWTANSMTPITVGDETSRFLDTWLSQSDLVSPSDYWLEVRLEKDGAHTVSTSSQGYPHVVDYSFLSQLLNFDNSEINFANGQSTEDLVLDPGEVLNVFYQAISATGSTLPTVAFDSGYVVDVNDNGEVDAGDQFLTGTEPAVGDVQLRTFVEQVTSSTSTSKTYNFPFELLKSPALEKIWFFIEASHAVNPAGNTNVYRQYFSLRDLIGSTVDLNAEDTQLVSSFNFSQGSYTSAGWAAGISTWAGKQASKLGVEGWNWGTPQPSVWYGEAGRVSTDANDLYTLTTPLFPIGENAFFNFNHTPDFTFNQSGGLVEYQIVHNGGQTTWKALDTTYFLTFPNYDSIPFPSNFSSYLAGKDVWMGLTSGARTDSVSIKNQMAINYSRSTDRVRFRFLFNDPSLDPTRAPTSDGNTAWSVSSFNYQANQLLIDNIFGLDTSKLTLVVGVDDMELTFLGNAPVDPNILTYEWFLTLTDLYDDNGNAPVTGIVGATIPFPLPNTGAITHYVRISHPLQPARIWPVTVTTGQVSSCPEGLDAILSGQNGSWPGEKSILDCVFLFNFYCSSKVASNP